MPQMQVQRYDADTYVIRQSVKTNFEAPFLYLLFGQDRALLLDTGAGGLTVRPTIDGLIADWLKAHHRASILLVVAHTHSHGDHRSGDRGIQGTGRTCAGGRLDRRRRRRLLQDRRLAARHRRSSTSAAACSTSSRRPAIIRRTSCSSTRKGNASAALRRHPLPGPSLCSDRPALRPTATASTASSPSRSRARSATSWAPISR